MAALVVGGPLTTAIFPANREPDLGDCTAHAPDGCRHWEGRRQVLRVELANRALAPDRAQLATYLQSPSAGPCCHVSGPQRTGPGQQPTVLEQLRRICKSHHSKCVTLEV